VSKRESGEESSRRGLREATFLERTEWPEAGGWLEAGVRKSGKSDAEVIALMDLDRGPDRLRGYYRGEHLPTPDTLRAICDAANLSYVEAVDRFGYYREIVRFFDDLVWLGARWLEEDDARGGTLGPLGEQASRLDSLRNTGVLYWKGEPITWGRQMPWSDKPGLDPSNIPEFTNRYAVGAWRELEHRNVRVEFPPIEAVPGGAFSLTVPHTLDRVDPSLRQESLIVPEHTVLVVLPKPIATAILLATLAFPLRGDGYKEGAPEYRYDLGRAADGLVREARRVRTELRAAGRPKSLHPLLQRTCDVLDDGRVPFNYRRPIAAEYVVMWADAICDRFNRYARLAAFDFWGEAGGRSWTITVEPQYNAYGMARMVAMPRPSAFAMRPQAELADLPEIDMLTSY
jgi:hypothetical protein